MTINSNLIDGVTLLFSNLIPNTLLSLMNPPTVYFIAFGICLTVLIFVLTLLISEHIREEYQEAYGYDPEMEAALAIYQLEQMTDWEHGTLSDEGLPEDFDPSLMMEE